MEPNTNVGSSVNDNQLPPNEVVASPVDNQSGPDLASSVSLLASAWNTFKANRKLLMMIVFVPMAIMAIGQILAATANPLFVLLAFIFLVVGAVFSVVMQPAMTIVLEKISGGATIGIKEAYKLGFGYFWSVILLAIMTMVIFAGSAVLFIVPVFIVMVYTSMYMFALVLDGKKGFGALLESYSLVYGRWWKVLGRMLFLVLIYLVGGLVLSLVSFVIEAILGIKAGSSGEVVLSIILGLILSVVIVPIVLTYMYNLYISLRASRHPSVITTAFKKWLIAFIIIGILAIIAVPVIGGVVALSLAKMRFNPENFKSSDSALEIQYDRAMSDRSIEIQ